MFAFVGNENEKVKLALFGMKWILSWYALSKFASLFITHTHTHT